MATEQEWAHYTQKTDGAGKLTEDAKFAQEVRNTPLQSNCILDLIWNNLQYANDHYYSSLWHPIVMRVDEYYESHGIKRTD